MNLSYCRWQNTLRDLEDCLEHLFDGDESDEELEARDKLIEVARDMVAEFDEARS